MAIIKCKMCGGDLELQPDVTIAECEYCGSVQTVPNQDNEKKLTLFARANRLRTACEFDKAAGIYESIVAEFPEEAEAYWGLVLCKYGIEYVDDPKTGKKIPTCHRSSFESVMDDSNYEQALENTDVLARKVMREEARVIEDIRKRIIEVSSKEEPYDVFICYKETDPKGQRTVDSMIAQNIYDTLTERGYRVFFARVTLVEDALGKEYEPFIFAALNSAPIMLALGTDYEHFNAVWVKNEWSRFLQMKEAGMNKTLIPCYRDMDAYDLPREFQALQAQNMGSISFMQDLVHGIEKILPKKKAQQVVEVQRGVSPNVESLLKRGNMFLEDKDWQSADKYFNDVLDIDPECAEAYLGKSMMQHKCMKPEGLVIARLAASANAKSQTRKALEPDEAREAEIAERYALHKYVRVEEIRKHFKMDADYASTVESRKQQLELEKAWFEQDKYMSRALRYAKGQTKMLVESIRQQVLDGMKKRIEEAEKADEASVKRICAIYEETLKIGDSAGSSLRKLAEQRRETDYLHYIKQMETAIEENDRKMLVKVKADFEDLLEYQDSPAMAEKAQAAIDAIDAKKRHDEEVQAAYEAENPIVTELPKVKAGIQEANKKINELTAKLNKMGGLVVTIILFAVSMLYLTAAIALDDGTMLGLGVVYVAVMALILVLVIVSRVKKNKERSLQTKELIRLRMRENEISQSVSLEEFTRVYDLRQTEEGRAQLAEEERQRRIREKIAVEAARKAAKKKIIKKVVTTAIILLVIAAIAVTVWYFVAHKIPGDRVKQAEAAIAAGDYQGAYDILNYHKPYANSEELLAQIAEHGKYVVTILGTDTSDFSSEETAVVFEYNERGLPVSYTSYIVDDLTAGEVPELGAQKSQYRIIYEWYDSGNLKKASFKRVEDKQLTTVFEFYDDPAADVVCIPGNAGVTGMDSSLHHLGLRFFGVSKKSTYNADGEVTYAYQYTPDGMTEGTTVERDAEGRIVSERVTSESGKTSTRTYTYAKNGDLKKAVFDYDVSDSGYDSSDYEREYKYLWDIYGKLQRWSYQDDDQDVTEYQEEYSYDAHNNVSTIRIERREDSSYGDDYLSWDRTYYLTVEWLDYATTAEKVAEEDAALRATISKAENLMRQHKYEEAIAIYETLITYDAAEDKILEARYGIAEDLAAAGALSEAYVAFQELGSYPGAKRQVKELFAQMLEREPRVIDIGSSHVVALMADGTVVAAGDNSYGQCNVQSWTDIVSIAAGEYHTVGLKADGTVVAVGQNNYDQCNTSGWTGIRTLRADSVATFGITEDGTVRVSGALPTMDAWNEVATWTDIVDICYGVTNVLGLKSDGTVVFTGDSEYEYEVSQWTEVIAISAEYERVAALRADGTVLYNQGTLTNVSNIRKIDTTRGGILGVNADGEVFCYGDETYGELEGVDWNDVVDLAATVYSSVLVHEDGTVTVRGAFASYMDVSEWNLLAAEESAEAEG